MNKLDLRCLLLGCRQGSWTNPLVARLHADVASLNTAAKDPRVLVHLLDRQSASASLTRSAWEHPFEVG